MAFHPDSVRIKKYILATMPTFINELAYIVSQVDDGKLAKQLSQNNVGTILAVVGDLLILSCYFASIDNDVLEDEMAIFVDVQGALIAKYNRPELTPAYYVKVANDNLIKHPEIYGKLSLPPTVFYLGQYDMQYGTKHADTAKAIFLNYANTVITADGKVTPEELKAYNEFKDLMYPPDIAPVAQTASPSPPVTPQPAPAQAEPAQTLDNHLAELNALVGLGNIKSDVTQLVNFLKVQQMRQAKGLPSVPITRHLVFSGNPGTGKTTVARLIAQIYQSLGILSQGHVVETDRSGLVAGYLGQTALKVQEVVTKALGGVLFIDEAYALTNDTQDEFGKEAIDTLLKLMEDNRNDLIVVVAGYTDKMDTFLLSNPGLKSRFNKFLAFDDYTPAELVAIFELQCKKAGFVIQPSAQAKLLTLFRTHHAIRDDTFGNGRLARNLFEQTLNNQANRIVMLANVNETVLSTIEPADIPNGVASEFISTI